MDKIADEQEVMAALADMITEVFAMESALLRAAKVHGSRERTPPPSPLPWRGSTPHTPWTSIERSARKVIAAVAEGDMCANPVRHPPPPR